MMEEAIAEVFIKKYGALKRFHLLGPQKLEEFFRAWLWHNNT